TRRAPRRHARGAALPGRPAWPRRRGPERGPARGLYRRARTAVARARIGAGAAYRSRDVRPARRLLAAHGRAPRARARSDSHRAAAANHELHRRPARVPRPLAREDLRGRRPFADEALRALEAA